MHNSISEWKRVLSKESTLDNHCLACRYNSNPAPKVEKNTHKATVAQFLVENSTSKNKAAKATDTHYSSNTKAG